VHKEIGPGLLESAYESCLTDELISRGLTIKTQVSLPIKFKGKEHKDAYRIDLLVEDCLIVEIKSVETLQLVHKQQVLTYLRFSGRRLGLLINFNSGLIKDGIKRVVL
jgi:GxxExxY protein